MTDRLALLVQPLISGRPAEDRGFDKVGNFDERWQEVKALAGVPPRLDFHDFRRTSARRETRGRCVRGSHMQIAGLEDRGHVPAVLRCGQPQPASRPRTRRKPAQSRHSDSAAC